MDNHYEQGEHVDPVCLRMQTKRRKLRSIKTAASKQLIGLDKERNLLWKARNKRVYVDLDPPYQKGWKRSFALRQDLSRSSYAPFFNSLLTKINTVQHSDRKDFKVKKRKHGRKIRVNRTQELKRLPEREWQTQLDDREKQLFYEVWQTTKKGTLDKFYVFAEPWRFVLRVRPNMITQARVIDFELESKYQRFENYIRGNCLEGTISKAKSKSDRRWKVSRGIINRCAYKKTLRQYADEMNDELFVYSGSYEDNQI